MATLAGIFNSVKAVTSPLTEGLKAAQGQSIGQRIKTVGKTLANTDIRVLVAGGIAVAAGVTVVHRIVVPLRGYMKEENLTITDLFDISDDPVLYHNRMSRMHRHRALKKIKKSLFREVLGRSKKKHKRDKKRRNRWYNTDWVNDLSYNLMKEVGIDPEDVVGDEFYRKGATRMRNTGYKKAKKPAKSQRIREWNTGLGNRENIFDFIDEDDYEMMMNDEGGMEQAHYGFRDPEIIDRLYRQVGKILNNRELRAYMQKKGCTEWEELIQSWRTMD